MFLKEYEISCLIISKYDNSKRENKRIVAYDEKEARRKMRESLKLFRGDLVRDWSVTEIK